MVAGEFRSFFASLYSSAASKSGEEMAEMLADIELPMLSQSQNEMLEAPITRDDIEDAISHLNPSKAPGSDGLPLEFYTTYAKTLVPRLNVIFPYISIRVSTLFYV